MKKFLLLLAVASLGVACSSSTETQNTFDELNPDSALINFNSTRADGLIRQSSGSKGADAGRVVLADWVHRLNSNANEFIVTNSDTGVPVSDVALTGLAINLDGTLTAGDVLVDLDDATPYTVTFGQVVPLAGLRFDTFDFAETETVSFTTQNGAAQSVEVPVLPRQGLLTFDQTLIADGYFVEIQITGTHESDLGAVETISLYESNSDGEGDYVYLLGGFTDVDITAVIYEQSSGLNIPSPALEQWRGEIQDLTVARADHHHFTIEFDPAADQTGLFTSFVGWNPTTTQAFTNVASSTGK